MNDHIGTPTLAQLTAEVAALRAQQTRYHTRTRRRSAARLRRFVAAGLVTLLVALVPLALLAANPFNDLNPGSVHNANIDAIYNAGITTGCVPNVSYCPNDYVTREQMASFLARTAGIGGNPPTTNAKLVGGYAPNGLVRVAYNGNTAANASVTLLGAQSNLPNLLAALSLTAPGPGFIQVSFGGYLNVTCAGCVATLIFGGGPSYAWSAASGPRTVAQSWVGTVSAAGAVSIPVYAMVLNPFSASPVSAGTFANPTLTAIYIPFGSTGGSTLGTDETAP